MAAGQHQRSWARHALTTPFLCSPALAFICSVTLHSLFWVVRPRILRLLPHSSPQSSWWCSSASVSQVQLCWALLESSKPKPVVCPNQTEFWRKFHLNCNPEKQPGPKVPGPWRNPSGYQELGTDCVDPILAFFGTGSVTVVSCLWCLDTFSFLVSSCLAYWKVHILNRAWNSSTAARTRSYIDTFFFSRSYYNVWSQIFMN